VYAVPPPVPSGAAPQTTTHNAPVPIHPTYSPVQGGLGNGHLTEEREYDYIGENEGYRLRKLTQYGYERPSSISVVTNSHLPISSPYSTLNFSMQLESPCSCRGALSNISMSTRDCSCYCCGYCRPDSPGCHAQKCDYPRGTRRIDPWEGSRATDLTSSKSLEEVLRDSQSRSGGRKRVSFEPGSNGELVCEGATGARESFLREKEREINERLRVLEERERSFYRLVGNANPNHQGMKIARCDLNTEHFLCSDCSHSLVVSSLKSHARYHSSCFC
jgi:hypothetical protein